MLWFERDDLTRPEVIGLLEEHLADMHATSPPESVHALDLEELRSPDVAFWTAWNETGLQGSGALKALGDKEAELKSMRTVRSARGQGVGEAMLLHLLDEARRAGIEHVYLETGSQPFFAPARRLYARHGFRERGPFADYRPDANSIFMQLAL
jgi:putative acetyltransferase